MGRTFAEKILGRAAATEVAAGDTVLVEPDLVLTHDDSGMIIEEAGRILPGSSPVRPDRIAIALGGHIPAASPDEAALHREIREFASRHSIRGFFDLGSGRCHHAIPESGLCFPGGLVLGTDESVAILGAFGCLTASIDARTAAALWAGGRWEARVPESVCIPPCLLEITYVPIPSLHMLPSRQPIATGRIQLRPISEQHCALIYGSP